MVAPISFEAAYSAAITFDTFRAVIIEARSASEVRFCLTSLALRPSIAPDRGWHNCQQRGAKRVTLCPFFNTGEIKLRSIFGLGQHLGEGQVSQRPVQRLRLQFGLQHPWRVYPTEKTGKGARVAE